MPQKIMGTLINNLVRIDRHFDASPAKIWQAWTDPALLKQWFGSDPEGKVLHANIDLHVGGHFEISFIDSDKTGHTCNGTYINMEINSLLQFTWTWKSEPGHESYITVLLSNEQDGTRMNFEHTNLGAASAHNYETGWRSTFKKLDNLLESQFSIRYKKED